MTMHRRVVLGALLGVLSLVGWAGLHARPDDKPGADKGHTHAHADKCAKACSECMRECEACARHCLRMVADGQKDHVHTLSMCADCGDLCALAAKVVSRHGPMAGPICEGCAKACDACATACEKSPDDEHMKRCAQACHDCAKACREMVSHAGPNQNREER